MLIASIIFIAILLGGLLYAIKKIYEKKTRNKNSQNLLKHIASPGQAAQDYSGLYIIFRDENTWTVCMIQQDNKQTRYLVIAIIKENLILALKNQNLWNDKAWKQAEYIHPENRQSTF